MSLIVRKLPMRLGWWDAPLMLRNLPKAIHMILTMGGSPFCSHGSFWAMMGHDSAFPVGPFLNEFHRGTYNYHPTTTVHQQEPATSPHPFPLTQSSPTPTLKELAVSIDTFNRYQYSSLNKIRASTELLVKNFFF